MIDLLIVTIVVALPIVFAILLFRVSAVAELVGLATPAVR